MSQQLIDAVTKGYMKNDVPEFRPGDTVRVHVRIKEGGKERIQIRFPKNPCCLKQQGFFNTILI